MKEQNNEKQNEYKIVDISDNQPRYDREFLIEKIAQYQLANERGIAKLLKNRTSTVRGITREFPSKWTKELIQEEVKKAEKEFEKIKDIEAVNTETDEIARTKTIKKTSIAKDNCYGDDIYIILSTNISIKSNYTIMWVVIRNYKIKQMEEKIKAHNDWDIAEEMIPLVKEDLIKSLREGQ